jgi:hypothetical protein
MIHSAVFLVACSSLAFEVLLTRIFSISQWNHLAFMVISIALFGFAASGTYLSIRSTRRGLPESHQELSQKIQFWCVVYSASVILSFCGLLTIPLDYFRLALEPVQALYLLAAYILLALPFFFAGLIISTTYSVLTEKTGLTYFTSMCGSAVGAVLPAVALPYLGEEQLVLVSAVLPLAVTAFACRRKRSAAPRFYRRLSGWLAAIVLLSATAGVLAYHADLFAVRPSPYKALSQLLLFPDTRIVDTSSSIRGRMDQVQSPYIRFAPGLSLKFSQSLPPQSSVFIDGDNQFVLYSRPPDNKWLFAQYSLPYAGYRLTANPRRVLIVQRGGGSAIPCALASGAQEVIVVEPYPRLARILRQYYPVSVVNQSARPYLAETTGTFDIIHVENWGTSLTGAAALDQDYLLTTEAIKAYLAHLNPGGVIVIARRLLLPPSDSVRLWATALEALRQAGRPHPESHLAMLRNWDTYVLLIGAGPSSAPASLKEFARTLNFDPIWLPGLLREEANRFNIFDEPYHFDTIERLAAAYRSGRPDAFFDGYPLDVVPQDDDRPFPGRVLKWPKARQLYRSMGSRPYALLMSGEVVIAVVFLEAIVVATLLLLLPFLFLVKGSRRPSVFQISYFLGVGAGFMFVELYFIKQMVILVGDPVISFTVTLAAILIYSSLGGLWVQKSRRLAPGPCLLALTAVIVLELCLLGRFQHYLLKLPEIWRFVGTGLVLLPPGVLMGLPFTLGLEQVVDSSDLRPYAWLANGCASVLASVISAQLAVSFGISVIMGCAAVAYLAVWFCAIKA